MTRIAITGASGVVGRALMRHWTDVEWAPFRGDVRDAGAVRAWIEAARPDAAVHLAAIVPVSEVERDPDAALAVNAGGTRNVADALRAAAPGCWLFLASTSHVYAPSAVPVAEDAPLDPISLYGATKLQAEEAARAHAPLCIGRIFSFSAPDQADDYFVPATLARIRAAAPGAELPIRGGRQLRDFLTTERIAAAIRILFARRAAGTFNIGSGIGTPLVALAAHLCAKLGRDDLRVVAAGETAGALVADAAKLRALGWSADCAVDALVAEMAS